MGMVKVFNVVIVFYFMTACCYAGEEGYVPCSSDGDCGGDECCGLDSVSKRGIMMAPEVTSKPMGMCGKRGTEYHICFDVPQPCSSDDDCEKGECCGLDLNLVSKRGIMMAPGVETMGTCRKRGTEKHICFDVPQPCSSDDDCEKGECCGLDLNPVSKRGIMMAPGVETMGTCRKRGTEKHICFDVPQPCSSDDDCEKGECCGLDLNPVSKRGIMMATNGTSKTMGTCRKRGASKDNDCQPSVEKRTPCTSQKQCKKDECCLSILQPTGKRGLEEQPQAYCEKRGICNEGCLMNNGNRKRAPSGKVFVGKCRCAKGLKCTPNGMTDIPLGPMGTCEPKRRKFKERKCKKLRG
ncbi:unnamed protein product [Owenia fusiformis]|uniref:Uncharacterized protein n=1 Tax=Owenia fusiformis TaxID=6347 RepID=A0A8S4NMC6_OWEFU|nr:unnamed protein product [Owenia fusiformis]